MECALKAHFATRTKEHDFPASDDKKVFSHRIDELLKLAGLEQARREREKTSPRFVTYWKDVMAFPLAASWWRH